MNWGDIKKDENNFWYRAGTGLVTVVFVHGILSDTRSCWHTNSQDSGAFWPDILAADSRFERLDIFLGGYYTDVDSGDYDVQQCSLELLSALRTRSENGTSVMDRQAVIFVCHSLGGIIVRHLLVNYQHLFKDKVVGLALIASPSLGSDYADAFSGLTKLYGNKVGQALRRQSSLLRLLDEQFRTLVDERRVRMPCLEGAEACESQGILHLKWLPSRWNFKPIVKLDAMGKYFNAPRIIYQTDHSSIVKPTSKDHPSHRFIVDFYQDKVVPRLRECLGWDATDLLGDPVSATLESGLTEIIVTISVKRGRTPDLDELRKRLEQLIMFDNAAEN